MKLKTRLIISFVVITILPAVLAGLVVWGVARYQIHVIEQTYGLTGAQYQKFEQSLSTLNQIPEVHDFIISMFIGVVLILALTAMLMILWIYGSLLRPIEKMEIAVKSITEGELDFELHPEKDDEIGQLCQDIETMRRRLKENAEEKLKNDKENKELISNISHDLKTPITAIKGYVEGIMDGVADTPEKMERYIKTIYNKANEMNTLINELTLYTKIDTNRIPYNFSPLSVNDYFNDCADNLASELESQGVEFGYFNYVEGDVKIIGDAEQLMRVVNNIISNSLKYMDKVRPRINLRVKDVGDFIQVELEDNGKGIDARDLPYIFDRFYRTDASRNSSKGGSGIGLSIVKKIIEEHGGKIWATSKPGTGTVMYFVIRKYQEVPIYE
ncbi:MULTISPECIES: sensor histidine kinase [Sellimonas]|uniref:histidine kinase n=1 Tax=Sellimonas caecigallum TaxID=2592333 RepID=A0ABS7L4W4_9FIRM|nr:MULTISPECIES: HAMP domain-containing sensor histidine kinase [Sellimonas]MBY0758106.1 HAMP domain-containing histidine kinase [Sellimonas caecigallum]OUP02608.1 two-component sensor histidine kinase [Drancourtella sp. An210]OUP66667.1 two-component sensor histidine kinase [Drancourtella sp. An177]